MSPEERQIRMTSFLLDLDRIAAEAARAWLGNENLSRTSPALQDHWRRIVARFAESWRTSEAGWSPEEAFYRCGGPSGGVPRAVRILMDELEG